MHFNLECEIANQKALYLERAGIWDSQALAIPAFLLKREPISGDCVHCGYDTEDKDDGEWLHDECRDELIADQREDYRLDDPRHGQAKWLNRR